DPRRGRRPGGVRDQPRSVALRAPVPRRGGVRARVRRADLPRARQGLEEASRRPPLHPRLAPRLRRGGPWLDFVSPGHGDVDFEQLFRALNRIGYDGPLSIEWEDSGMDRDWGARDALAFVRRTDFAPSAIAFDAAMQRSGR